MNEFKFYIPRRLPGLNEIIKWSKSPIPWLSKGKGRVYRYTIEKKRIEQQIIFDIYKQHHPAIKDLPCFEECTIDFQWIESNRRRDPSNVCAGGRKFILDALVKVGILTNDNWLVSSHTDAFRVDKSQAGVVVTITEGS